MSADESIPVKPCGRARTMRAGRKAKAPVPHDPHLWAAGEYLPVGDTGDLALCPGYREEGK